LKTKGLFSWSSIYKCGHSLRALAISVHQTLKTRGENNPQKL